jgi:hypothetical protein
MQVLEEEHHLQMEILTIQRDRAAVKLNTANFKLNACKSSFQTYFLLTLLTEM